MHDSPREQALKFGENGALVGVLTEPSRAMPVLDDPAVVLLNSGLLHRVGAARFHVRLARSLAGLGFRVLRFDFSGIGDSEPRRDALSFEEGAVHEVIAAMDLLSERRDAQHFLLMGLCSGADMAFKTAVVDERVIGLMQLDAWAYRTPGYYFHHYASRLFRLDAWKLYLSTRIRRILGKGRNGSPTVGDSDALVLSPYAREFPAKEEVESELAMLLDRDLHFLNIFSGGQPDEFNHRGQYERCFSSVDFRGRVEVEYVPEANHIFSGLEHQQFVIDRTVRWIERFIPAQTKRPPEPKHRRAFETA